MKRVLISIILGRMVFTANGEISSKALKWNLAIAEGTVQQRGGKKITRLANDFPGADLGAKINAADKDLAGVQGEILVRGGGTISTQVIVSPGHILRLAPGTYTLATELVWEGAILLKSQTTVVGSGWDTVIVEPPLTGWIVFQSFEDIRTQPIHYGPDSNISISDLQIKGANPAST